MAPAKSTKLGLTATPSVVGREMARDILAREIAGAREPEVVSAAMQRLLARISQNLRNSVGDDGYLALISRAIARTQAEHPAINNMRRDGGADISVDGLAASVDAHGLHTVTAAVESLLGSLADLLSGLIGADMVLNLLDPDRPFSEETKRGESR